MANHNDTRQFEEEDKSARPPSDGGWRYGQPRRKFDSKNDSAKDDSPRQPTSSGAGTVHAKSLCACKI